jgi:hypothetical protein
LRQELSLMSDHLDRELPLPRHFDRELALLHADLRRLRWMIGSNTALILVTLAAVLAS